MAARGTAPHVHPHLRPVLTWGPTLATPRGGVTLCIGPPILGCPGVGAEGRGLRSGLFPSADANGGLHCEAGGSGCWGRVLSGQALRRWSVPTHPECVGRGPRRQGGGAGSLGGPREAAKGRGSTECGVPPPWPTAAPLPSSLSPDSASSGWAGGPLGTAVT